LLTFKRASTCIITAKPTADLCWECQKNNTAVIQTAIALEYEKRQTLEAQKMHLQQTTSQH